MSDHEHEFEGAWWHVVASTEEGVPVWVRLCRHESGCSAYEECVGELPDAATADPVLTSVTPSSSVHNVSETAEWKEPDMAAEEIQNVREGRHLAKIALAKALHALEGQPGLTQEEQVECLNKAQAAVQEANVALQQVTDLAVKRDFEAYAETKDGTPGVGHLYFEAAAEAFDEDEAPEEIEAEEDAEV